MPNLTQLQPITLTGDVVRLEPLGLQHLEGLREAVGTERETYGLTWVPLPTQESVRGYIESALSQQAAGTSLPFATIRIADNAVCGSSRLMNAEFWPVPVEAPVHPSALDRSTPQAVEIGGSWLGSAYQRSAINTEAKYLMLRHAFETWNVLRLTFKTDARNARSRANIERVGAKFEGILRAHMYAFDGEIRDSAMYSITRDEWPEVKRGLAEKLQRSVV